MERWTGETITLQLGAKWTYKLRLEEQTDRGPETKLVLATRVFDTEQEARSAGDSHLKAELARRSS